MSSRQFIAPLHDFQDAGQQFYAGERRSVTAEQAGYYCGVGWAKDASDGSLPTGSPDLSEKTLEVQSGKHTTAARQI